MAKTCAELFEGIDPQIIGDPQTVVEGLQFDSRAVKPGDMFFCIVGANSDGHDFAEGALTRGASVIVAERELPCVSDAQAQGANVTLVIVENTRKTMADVACAFYDHPSDAFSLVGVTGTNGKTTTTYLIDHIAEKLGKVTGLIGTTGTRIADQDVKSNHTTPDSIELQGLFARMEEAGCQVVSMEVSSHALDLDRVRGSRFAVTVFTNLTQDHLDYHHSFEEYFAVKSRLFSEEFPAKRVICIGDEWARKLVAQCQAAGDDVITCASSRDIEGTADANITITAVEYLLRSTRLTLNAQGKTRTVTYPMTGSFNVDNVLCAIGAALQLGFDLDAVLTALESARAVPGRMQDVSVGLEGKGAPTVIVDYAHTPDALERTIASVKALTPGKTILVFGCEGNRDEKKRPIMGAISLDADHVVLTTDNTHKDDQAAINAAVLEGMRKRAVDEGIDLDAKVDLVEDRREAMEHAIALAGPEDAVVMTGRGHELYMEYGEERVFFDDRLEAREALENVLAERERAQATRGLEG